MTRIGHGDPHRPRRPASATATLSAPVGTESARRGLGTSRLLAHAMHEKNRSAFGGRSKNSTPCSCVARGVGRPGRCCLVPNPYRRLLPAISENNRAGAPPGGRREMRRVRRGSSSEGPCAGSARPKDRAARQGQGLRRGAKAKAPGAPRPAVRRLDRPSGRLRPRCYTRGVPLTTAVEACLE
jgi:hypothetical protein